MTVPASGCGVGKAGGGGVGETGRGVVGGAGGGPAGVGGAGGVWESSCSLSRIAIFLALVINFEKCLPCAMIMKQFSEKRSKNTFYDCHKILV